MESTICILLKDMKRIKETSKLGAQYLYCYENAKATSVKQLYKQPSSTKVRAEENCLSQMEQEHGEGYKVLGGNAFYFTAAWITAEGLRVETGTNSYLIYYR